MAPSPCSFVLIVVAMALCGCGSAASPLVPVHFRVTLDSRPLPRGSVSLRPENVDGGQWEQPTGTIREDGGCEIFTTGQPGALPGVYRVVVVATESPPATPGRAHPGLPRSIIPSRYNRAETTPLTVTVSMEEASKVHDLALLTKESKP